MHDNAACYALNCREKICNSKNKILGGRNNDAGLFLYDFHIYMNKFSNAVM
jgi:hypothetical protein